MRAAVLTAASALILVFLVWNHPLADVGLALLVALFPVALIVQGATPERPPRVLTVPLSLLALVLVASLVGLVWLSSTGRVTTPLLGVPLSLWILTLGLVVVPLAIVTWAHGRKPVGQDPN